MSTVSQIVDFFDDNCPNGLDFVVFAIAEDGKRLSVYDEDDFNFLLREYGNKQASFDIAPRNYKGKSKIILNIY